MDTRLYYSINLSQPLLNGTENQGGISKIAESALRDFIWKVSLFHCILLCLVWQHVL